MNLFFRTCGGELWWKLGDLPNGDVLDAVNREGHDAEFALLVEFGRFGWSACVRVAWFAIDHDVE